MVTIDEFRKLEIVTAKVLDAQDHPNADKLYVLQIDIGDEKRQIVAGIRDFYTKEEMVGRMVVVIKNLQPAVIRGVESNGMMLATKDGQTLSVLTTERDVKIGSPIS